MTRNNHGFTLIELMIVVSIIGILAVIAIPDFLRFTGKARQAEARTNLGGIYVAEMAYYGDTGEFAGQTIAGKDAFQQIGWEIKSQAAARYTYILDEAVCRGREAYINLPAAVATDPSVGFTAIAAGNIDKDAFLDVWAVNNKKIFRNMVPSASDWEHDGSDINN